MTFSLAHLSDVHLGPLPAVAARELMSKRLTGYINWHRSRAGALGEATLERVTRGAAECGADHIAVTGDLTNLALEAELRAAALWLAELGTPETVSAIPGNHDAYVRGALDRTFQDWGPWMTGDDGVAPASNGDFPFVRVRGPVAIIGTSSAVATPAFVAAGRFESAQAERLARALDEAGKAGLFRVILIHHPPVHGATIPRKRLYGIRLFQEVVAKAGAELVLHGHTHLAQRHEIDGPDGTHVPVIGVPAAGQSPGARRPPGAYNLFAIDGEQGRWRCKLQQWSATTETGPLELTEETLLHPGDG